MTLLPTRGPAALISFAPCAWLIALWLSTVSALAQSDGSHSAPLFLADFEAGVSNAHSARLAEALPPLLSCCRFGRGCRTRVAMPSLVGTMFPHVGTYAGLALAANSSGISK